MKEVIYVTIHTRKEYINRVEGSKSIQTKIPNSKFQVINDFLNNIIFHFYDLKMSSDGKKQKQHNSLK